MEGRACVCVCFQLGERVGCVCVCYVLANMHSEHESNSPHCVCVLHCHCTVKAEALLWHSCCRELGLQEEVKHPTPAIECMRVHEGETCECMRVNGCWAARGGEASYPLNELHVGVWVC